MAAAGSLVGAVPVVGAREPCPCGSGRRYKACHGKAAAAPPANRRPFAGRVDEGDLVCLREVVPSATAPLRLTDHPGTELLLGTVLPMAWPLMVRSDARRMIGLQTAVRSTDLDRDLGQAALAAVDAPAGAGGDALGDPGSGPGLVSMLDPAPLEITIHAGFDWWLEGIEDPGEEAASALSGANASVVPTSRLTSVNAAYWCLMGERAHLRWALTEDEEPLLDAMARLVAARSFDIGEGSRFVGAFRALGLVVPVWDLPGTIPAEEFETPVAALRGRLDDALADHTPLTSEQRRARAGVVSRQLTLR